MDTNLVQYAGFWPRLRALLLDLVFLLPLTALVAWGISQHRLFRLFYLVPGILFGLLWNVYLVRRFGGTPGKLVADIRIQRLNGEPIGYRDAILRYLPEFIFGFLLSVALVIPMLKISDAQYNALSFIQKGRYAVDGAPLWYNSLNTITNIWVLSEFIVLLTNQKKRALHDFLAGTVVVYKSPHPQPQRNESQSANMTECLAPKPLREDPY